MKRIPLLVLMLATLATYGAGLSDKKKKVTRSQNEILIGKDTRKESFMAPSATITLANGSKKNLEHIVIGDQLTTCTKGQQMTTIVTGITVYENPSAPLMSIYLRPDGPEHKMVPAILLEATGHHSVQTTHGRKQLRKLKKKDILYRYDADTGAITTWQVGAIKTNSKKISKAYQLTTEAGTFLADNLLVTNH